MFNRLIKLTLSDWETTELRIAFKVTKSLVGYPNLAEIKIYNMSDSSINKISTRGLKVNLYAGYENTGLKLLFNGDIINVVPLPKEGVDTIIQVFAADGINILKTATVNKTLSAGATMAQVYDELVGSMQGIAKGVTEGVQKCLSGKQSLLRALHLSGNVKDWLDKIAKECGFEYSVNDGVIETTQTGTPLSDIAPVVVNQSTGMIGSPERSDQGINVKHLLLPELKLARTVKIQSTYEQLNVGNLFFRKVPEIKNQGTYRIDKLEHTGDTHGNDWTSKIFGRIF